MNTAIKMENPDGTAFLLFVSHITFIEIKGKKLTVHITGAPTFTIDPSLYEVFVKELLVVCPNLKGFFDD